MFCVWPISATIVMSCSMAVAVILVTRLLLQSYCEKKHLIKKFSIFLLFSKSKTLILKSPPSIIFLSFFSFLEKKSLKYFHLLLTLDLVVCKLYWNDVSRSFILNFYNKWFNVMIINAQIFVNVLTKRFINKDTELTPLWPFLILFSL